MIYLTRRERFCAAHRLFRADWDDDKNRKVFGQCSNPNWHGHNYVLFVTVKGEINSETGFLINLKDLSKILKEHVIGKIDHKNLNTEVDFLQRKIISTENIAISIWEQIEPHIKALNARLHCVKIVETENNYVEYFGS